MSWREQLQKGKFRDAEFLINSSAGGLGRRIALHEYPLRDLPYAEDMGRKARTFSLEIFVIGPEYMAARDKLIEAFETPGPGSLVHPYRGSLQVVATSVSGPMESTGEGGMASFSVTFVEAGENKQPSVGVNTSAVVNSQANSAITVISSGFSETFSVAGFPEFVSTEASDLVTNALVAISTVSRSIPTLPAEAATFAAGLALVSSSLSSLILQPANLAADVTSLVSGLASLTDSPENALKMYNSLWSCSSCSPDPVSITTPSRQAQSDNQVAVIALVQQTAVVEAARASADMDFDNYDQAVGVRDEIADQLDEEMETAADDAYFALADLRVAMVTDITSRGADMARLAEHSLAVSMPALVVAHRLYDDAGRDAEIVSRNNVRHPGFVPAGIPLEVVTNV